MTSFQLMVLELVSKVGLEAAEALLNGMKNASTIEDAIKAMQDAQKAGWKEAKVAPIQ